MLEDEPDVDEENNITVIGWAQEIHAPTSRLQIGRDTDLFPYGEREGRPCPNYLLQFERDMDLFPKLLYEERYGSREGDCERE